MKTALAPAALMLVGQGRLYSSIGCLLVRQLIEQTTGRNLDAALKSLILNPLRLSSVRLA